MDYVEYYANLILENNNDVSVVENETFESIDTLIRCYINPWNGVVSVLLHRKDNDNWSEPGKTIGSIYLDENDTLTVEY